MAVKNNKCPECGHKVPLGRHKPAVDGKVYCSVRCENMVEGISSTYEEKLALIAQRVMGSTAWRPDTLEPVLDIVTGHPVLVISDVHCPIHSQDWLTHAINCGLRVGARECIINGDLIDANFISRHAGSYYRRNGQLENDLDAAESVLGILCDSFDKVYMSSGNHDMRLIHRFGGEISVQKAYKLFGSFDNFRVSARSFLTLNKTILVGHPRQYSKIRGKLTQDLCARHQKHVITGHHHHSATAISPCGSFQAIEVGCIMDIDLADYVRNEISTHVEMLNGFAIVQGQSIQNFNKFSPWSLFGLPEFPNGKKKK